MGYSDLMGMAKVWPLQRGIKGVNAQGEEIDLQLGVPGWVPIQDAIKLEAEGKLQRMAGTALQDLKKPNYSTAAVKVEDDDLGLDDPAIGSGNRQVRNKRYRRTDSVAEHK